MSVTAVPLRPIAKDALPKLWIGIVLAVIAAVAFAWFTTGREAAIHGSAEDFLAWNADQSGVVTTDSGLQYRILEGGDGGEHPGATDAVLINYEGRLVTGEVFDSGERVPMNLGQVLPGFTEALLLMDRGARYRVWLPPSLGYGASPPPDSQIEPDSVMEFDIELIDFISQDALMRQMQQQMGGEGAEGGEAPAAPAGH